MEGEGVSEHAFSTSDKCHTCHLWNTVLSNIVSPQTENYLLCATCSTADMFSLFILSAVKLHEVPTKSM